MCSKVMYLISFVVVVSLLGDVQVIATTWTDGGSDHLWSTPANWDTGTAPTDQDLVTINILPGPTIAKQGAVANIMVVGQGHAGPGGFTVDGGTLTVGTFISLAHSSGSKANDGYLTMKSGSINSGQLYVGNTGPTTLDMTGGNIETSTFWIAVNPTGIGHVNLHGGVITTSDFLMRRDAVQSARWTSRRHADSRRGYRLEDSGIHRQRLDYRL